MSDILRTALESIANSTCCGDCTEAKKVAQEALAASAESPEAVAWAVNTPYGRGYSFAEEFFEAYPNFPKTSNVEALIAEIDAIDCEYLDDYEIEVKKIVSKYRNGLIYVV